MYIPTMPLLMHLDPDNLSDSLLTLTADLDPIHADLISSYRPRERHERSIRRSCDTWSPPPTEFRTVEAETMAMLKDAMARRGIREW
jgi:hypothetical protein